MWLFDASVVSTRSSGSNVSVSLDWLYTSVFEWLIHSICVMCLHCLLQQLSGLCYFINSSLLPLWDSSKICRPTATSSKYCGVFNHLWWWDCTSFLCGKFPMSSNLSSPSPYQYCTNLYKIVPSRSARYEHILYFILGTVETIARGHRCTCLSMRVTSWFVSINRALDESWSLFSLFLYRNPMCIPCGIKNPFVSFDLLVSYASFSVGTLSCGANTTPSCDFN